MRYAVLAFPRLPIQLARKADAALTGRRFALTRGDGDTALLAAVSPEATASGVEPGMTALQAGQRCPGIELVPEQPAGALDALETVSAIIRRRATTDVAIVSRNEIAVVLDDFAQQFAGEPAAALALTGLVRSWSGLDARCGVASSLDEASLAARTARRFPVINPASEAAPKPLPRYEPLSAAFSWQSPATAETVEVRLGRLAAHLEPLADARRQSYREVLLELEYGPYRRAIALHPELPMHTAAEALSLVRGRVAVEELGGVTALRVTLGQPGPDVRIDPWRAPVAQIHQISGPAVPVQRRLLRAS